MNLNQKINFLSFFTLVLLKYVTLSSVTKSHQLKQIRFLNQQSWSDVSYFPNQHQSVSLNEDEQLNSRSQFVHFSPLEPTFDENIEKNLTVPLGSTAFLQCKVKHLGDRTVSWVRQKDLQILTFSNRTYTSDQRFSCIHVQNTDDWTLKIFPIKQSDSGIYDCQVSTEPKISLKINLEVIDVQAKILEGDILHVKNDKTLSLNCIVNYATNSTNNLIFWYHNFNLLNYNKDVTIKYRIALDKTTNSSYLHSNLKIPQVNFLNNGNYSCKLTNTGFAISSNQIDVHILEHGEIPKAINYISNDYKKHLSINEFDSFLNNSNNCYPSLLIFLIFFIKLFQII